MSDSPEKPDDVGVAAGVEAPPEVTAEPVPDVASGTEAEPDVATEPEPDVEAEPEPDVATEPEPEVATEAEPDVAAEPEPEVAAEAAPEPDVPDAGAVAEAPVEAGARYCWMCDDRVPLAADGLHCYLGHRLSPAHAKRRRGLFRRR
jgi:hypothetical protein